MGRGFHAEQDAHAWSIRVFAKAVPNMFLRAVKEGKIAALQWDEVQQKVVNQQEYEQIR